MTSPTIISIIPKNSRESVRVALDEYRGINLVDIRVMVELNPETGLPVPTKKGVSLKIERLPDLLAALHDAEDEARKRGLLVEIEKEVAG
jgi:hypothetical protein